MAIAVHATEPKKAVQRAVPDRAKPQETPPPENDFEDALEQAARKEESAPAQKPKPVRKGTKAEKPDDAPATEDDAPVEQSESVDQADTEGEAVEAPVAEVQNDVDLPLELDIETEMFQIDPAHLLELPIAPIAAQVVTDTPDDAPIDEGAIEECGLPDGVKTELAPSAPLTEIRKTPERREVTSTTANTPQAEELPSPQPHPKPTITSATDTALSEPKPQTPKDSALQPAPVDAPLQSIESIPAPDSPTPSTTASHSSDRPASDLAASITDSPKAQTTASSPALKPAPLPDAAPPELRFAHDNHERIVTNVRTQLLPGGGSMQIRLDPPELGALKVMVEMRDGVMTATFQTSSDEATRLLSHSLNQLKHVLEGQGVSIERLQVQQAPKSEQSRAGDEQNQQQQSWSDEHAAKQEQQRKELLRRAWRKASGLSEPIDFMA